MRDGIHAKVIFHPRLSACQSTQTPTIFYVHSRCLLSRSTAGNVSLLWSNQELAKTVTVQGDYIGFNTGNGEKLIYSQAEADRGSCLAVA